MSRIKSSHSAISTGWCYVSQSVHAHTDKCYDLLGTNCWTSNAQKWCSSEFQSTGPGLPTESRSVGSTSGKFFVIWYVSLARTILRLCKITCSVRLLFKFDCFLVHVSALSKKMQLSTRFPLRLISAGVGSCLYTIIDLVALISGVRSRVGGLSIPLQLELSLWNELSVYARLWCFAENVTPIDVITGLCVHVIPWSSLPIPWILFLLVQQFSSGRCVRAFKSPLPDNM